MVSERNLTNSRERQLALAGGGLLLLLGVRKGSWPGLLLGGVGTLLLVRSLRGDSARQSTGGFQTADAERQLAAAPAALTITESLTVGCPPQEAYAFWRKLENLPRFMTHLQSVRVEGNGRSHWVVKAPAGLTFAYDAEITADAPGELIRWQTLPQAIVQHTGKVAFRPAPGGRGTEVTAHLHYEPPGGIVGEAFAHLASPVTEQLIREDVRRFKAVLETGEAPTIEGQPAARKS